MRWHTGIGGLLGAALIVLSLMSGCHTSHDIHITLDIRHIESVVASDSPAMQTRDLAGDMTAGFVSGQAEFTPVLREAVLSRNLRHDEIRGFLEKGLIGEGNLGLVEVRLETAAQIAEPDKNRLASLVAEENEDRQKIYNEYAQIKGLDIGGWSEVPLHFAEEIRQQLMPGDWFQVPGHPDFYTRFLEGPIAPFFPTEPTPSAWVQIPAAYMSPSAPREAAPPME